MKRLSKDEIFTEEQETAMSEEVKHPGRVSSKIENDYINNGVTDSRDPNFRWNSQTMSVPDHHALATADIKERQARQAAHDDARRLELAKKAK